MDEEKKLNETDARLLEVEQVVRNLLACYPLCNSGCLRVGLWKGRKYYYCDGHRPPKSQPTTEVRFAEVLRKSAKVIYPEIGT